MNIQELLFFTGGVSDSGSRGLHARGSQTRALLWVVKQLGEKEDQGERIEWERPFAVTLLTGPTRTV